MPQLPALVEPSEHLLDAEVRRYSRHLIIPELGVSGQRRLKSARVLCVGAGGLGSPALIYLAAAGVGTLGIVEFDLVDESNLQRQVIHGQSDLGRPKAISARESIREINPFVEVVLHQEALTSHNAMEICAGYDLIVDCSDNFATRYLVNDAAVFLHKPYVWGSIFRLEGQASVFWADHGPCYRCLYPQPPAAGSVPSCAEGGVVGAVCATIGSLQVAEVIKLVTGVGESLLGSLAIYDAAAMTVRKIKIRKDPGCAICGEAPTVTGLVDYQEFCGLTPVSPLGELPSITVRELRSSLESGEPIHLVDVREPAEYEIVKIQGATLIPKGEILDGSGLAKLPRDRRIVVYCKSGVRSAQALAVLIASGFTDATHLEGGVLEWVRKVDPTLPSY